MLVKVSRDLARFEAVQVGRLLLASFREDALSAVGEGGSATTGDTWGTVGLMN